MMQRAAPNFWPDLLADTPFRRAQGQLRQADCSPVASSVP